jgi:hypothetical protein
MRVAGHLLFICFDARAFAAILCRAGGLAACEEAELGQCRADGRLCYPKPHAIGLNCAGGPADPAGAHAGCLSHGSPIAILKRVHGDLLHALTQADLFAHASELETYRLRKFNHNVRRCHAIIGCPVRIRVAVEQMQSPYRLPLSFD